VSSFLPCSQALPSVSLTESQLPLLLPPLFFTICSLRISSFLFSTIPLHQQCFLPRWFPAICSSILFLTLCDILHFLRLLTTALYHHFLFLNHFPSIRYIFLFLCSSSPLHPSPQAYQQSFIYQRLSALVSLRYVCPFGSLLIFHFLSLPK